VISVQCLSPSLLTSGPSSFLRECRGLTAVVVETVTDPYSIYTTLLVPVNVIVRKAG
jgi:hypothetical protein